MGLNRGPPAGAVIGWFPGVYVNLFHMTFLRALEGHREGDKREETDLVLY